MYIKTIFYWTIHLFFTLFAIFKIYSKPIFVALIAWITVQIPWYEIYQMDTQPVCIELRWS